MSKMTTIIARAFRGVADDQHRLALMYKLGQCRDGVLIQQDLGQAAWWYRKAAEQGLAVAQFSLGAMYFNGEGVPHDDEQAVAWFRKAADQGHAFAQLNLGRMYASASRGNLGTAYYVGEGAAKDDVQAEAWYRKAAEQGNAEAQRALGRMYEDGRGAPQDGLQAAAWGLVMTAVSAAFLCWLLY